MYGGKIKELISGETKDNGDSIMTEPDITDEKKGVLREVKSVKNGGGLNFSAEQISKYVLLQTKDYFKKPPKIRYELFRHNLKNLQKDFKKKGVEDLVSTLTSSIRYSVSLPFSVVFQFYANHNKYCYYHDGSTYMECVKLNSSGLHTLLASPEEFIEGIGLPVERFKIEKRKFPGTVTMNGQTIPPFPMLFVYDNEYKSSFVNNLSKIIESDKELSSMLARYTRGLVGEFDFDEEEFHSDFEKVFGPPLKGPVPF